MTNHEFKTIRKRFGQTHKQFSETLGKSLRSIYNYETDGMAIPKVVEILVNRLVAEKDFQESVKR